MQFDENSGTIINKNVFEIFTSNCLFTLGHPNARVLCQNIARLKWPINCVKMESSIADESVRFLCVQLCCDSVLKHSSGA